MKIRFSLLLVLAIVPQVLFAGSDPNQKRGFTADQVYQLGDLDHVNAFSGNVIIRLPLGQVYTVGPTLQYQFVLTYNSKIWDYKSEEHSFPGCATSSVGCSLRYGVPERNSNAGFGWTLSLGRLIPATLGPPKRGWIYLGPDASEHEFVSTLGPNSSDEMDPTTAITTDASYLKMIKYTGYREVWFPNGDIHRFDDGGQLTQMRDRRGNWVRLEYETAQQRWKIIDGFGDPNVSTNVARTHYMYVSSTGTQYGTGNFPSLVTKLELEAFDNTPSDTTDPARNVYLLTQTGSWVGRGGAGERDGSLPSQCVAAPLLTQVQLPDGSTYIPAYHVIEGSLDSTPTACAPAAEDRFSVMPAESGVIRSLKLPTRGSIEWVHGIYPMNLQQCLIGTGYTSEYVGVRERTYKDSAGNALMKWTYTPALSSGQSVTQRCENEGGAGGTFALSSEFTNDIEIWSSVSSGKKLRTRNYFSVFPEGAPAGANGLNADGFTAKEYGLPFTHLNALTISGHPSGSTVNRYLSTEVADCTAACTTLRKNYVTYAMETDASSLAVINKRPESERTVNVADTSCGDANCFTDTNRDDWDGYGHARRSISTTNIPGSSTRTSFVNYTPDATSWLLEKYTDSSTKEGTSGTKSIANFDATYGDLKSVRKLRATGDPATLSTGNHDLLTAWCRDSRGFVTSERYFGGDSSTVPSVDYCTATRATGQFFLNHTYTPDASAPARIVRHQARYAGGSHDVVDEFLDWRTGLPWKTEDAADVATEYRFDSLNRLTSLQPAGMGWSSYVYSAPGVAPSVTERLCANGSESCTSSLSLAETRHYYDDLGRLVQQSRRMGSSTNWASTWLRYDGAGRKVAVSSTITTTSGGSATMPSATRETVTQFDVLGRPTTVTAPDNKATLFDYTGMQDVKRTSDIATGATSSSVKTAEKYDSAGRLIAVIENADATTATTTNYTYDAEGHLVTVNMPDSNGTQQRSFTYDGVGFLTSETHPESGVTNYTYDSRGHMITRETPVGSLTYEYDASERLTKVTDDALGVLKELSYDRPSTTGDLSFGKLAFAIRHNQLPAAAGGDVEVKETYTYGDTAGRLTLKKTEVENGPTFVDSYTYNDFNKVAGVTYPTCTGCTGLNAPSRTVNSVYKDGLLTKVDGYTDPTNGITYHANGLLNTLQHVTAQGVSGPLYTQTISATTKMARPDSITVTNFSICTPPTANISAPATATSSQVITASTASPQGSTYAWSIQSGSGTIVGSTTDSSVSVRVGCSGSVTLKVVVSNCGTSVSATRTVSITAPTGTLSGTQSIPVGGTASLNVSLTALSSTAPFALTWSPGGLISYPSTSITRSVTPSNTTTYTVTSASDNYGCAIAVSGSAVVTVIPDPVMVGATALSTSTVRVQWTYSGPVDSFTIERLTRVGSSSVWQTAASGVAAGARTFDDAGRTADTAYVYRVKAVHAGVASRWSASDLALTTMFLNDPIVAGSTIVQAAHSTQLRAAIDAVRLLGGLGAATYTGTTPAAVVVIAPAHVEEMRTRLDEARAALSLPSASYSERPLGTLAVVKAVHINDLRGGLK